MFSFFRYYVQGSSSSQSVQYLADDWGYHPIVEYSNVGPHSKTVTQIALGKEAVQALQNSDKVRKVLPKCKSIKQILN